MPINRRHHACLQDLTLHFGIAALPPRHTEGAEGRLSTEAARKTAVEGENATTSANRMHRTLFFCRGGKNPRRISVSHPSHIGCHQPKMSRLPTIFVNYTTESVTAPLPNKTSHTKLWFLRRGLNARVEQDGDSIIENESKILKIVGGTRPLRAYL